MPLLALQVLLKPLKPILQPSADPTREPTREHSKKPLESNDESQGNGKRLKLITSNAKPLQLIASKQRTLQEWKNSPEDQRELTIWPTYLEGVEEWRQYYSEDFPKHYKANAVVSYKHKLKRCEVSFPQFEW